MRPTQAKERQCFAESGPAFCANKREKVKRYRPDWPASRELQTDTGGGNASPSMPSAFCSDAHRRLGISAARNRERANGLCSGRFCASRGWASCVCPGCEPAQFERGCRRQAASSRPIYQVNSRLFMSAGSVRKIVPESSDPAQSMVNSYSAWP